MSPQEFAQSIKAKYPQYKNVDDVKLAKAMIEKYPQYASKVNFEEQAPQDGVKLWDTSGFKSGFTGIGKGLGKLALGVGTLGRGIQRAITPKALEDTMMGGESIFDTGSEQRAKADEALKAKNTGESISSFITEAGATALPGGAAYKATKGLGFMMKMLGRTGTGAVVGTVQGGGDIDRDTAIGAAVEGVFPMAGKALDIGGGVLKRLASVGGGTGTDVIEQVLKTPRAALAGGKGESNEVLKQTANSIRNGIKTIRQKAGDEFASLTKDHTEQLDKKAFDKLVGNFLKDVNETSFIETTKLDKIKNVIQTWDDYSAQGLNKLASKLSKFYSGSQNAVDTDRVVSGLNRTIRDWVGKQVPDIAEANAKYADKMDLVEQMEAIFKTKGSVDDRLGMQKTAEAVSRLFNANRNIAREGVEELEKELGVDILGREAGRQLGAGSITKFQMADGATGVARSLLPQSAILKLTAATGLAKNALEARLDALDPLARAMAIEVLTDLLGEGKGQDQPQKE